MIHIQQNQCINAISLISNMSPLPFFGVVLPIRCFSQMVTMVIMPPLKKRLLWSSKGIDPRNSVHE